MSDRQHSTVHARTEARPGMLRIVLGTLWLWWHRHRSRQLLAEMDARMRHDIGVSRIDAREEARKWFWQK
jgi:uncharacterized protein YjiS (DUF1127 family)